MVRVRVHVETSEVDPLMRDRIKRWLVSVRVLEVLEGTLPDDIGAFSLLVHSPSRDFQDVEIVGHDYVVTREDPFNDPYEGELVVEGLG
jgi:hypothetical protein